ncbi:HAD family phosphatase [Pseudomonas sp. W4I3]|uniref:HAD family hydrolase n=1 Tax=Pseudomonas sp. W4I3 TaxID=3042294 RepID=UPI002783F955|nr:HAD family phosphatase [Pseudomonas sp. W4I3]MDQ0740778.1 HAD superfamily hydrolase (TIGR01509 family) [Pseudomonas sp. W4I3]
MTIHTFTAVCFDMDGVLIQSRDVIEHAWSSVARKYGVEISQDFIHEHIHGRPGEYTLDALFPSFDQPTRRIIKEQVDAAEEVAVCSLVPGVATLISHLRERSVPLALVTSSWPARIAYVLNHHRLETAFECIVSREDVSSGKPAPDCYQLAARKLNNPINECLVFEDSVSGVQSAVSSGAICLGIGHDVSLRNHGAKSVYADFNALPTIESSTPTSRLTENGLVLGSHSSRRSPS